MEAEGDEAEGDGEAGDGEAGEDNGAHYNDWIQTTGNDNKQMWFCHLIFTKYRRRGGDVYG